MKNILFSVLTIGEFIQNLKIVEVVLDKKRSKNNNVSEVEIPYKNMSKCIVINVNTNNRILSTVKAK